MRRIAVIAGVVSLLTVGVTVALVVLTHERGRAKTEAEWRRSDPPVIRNPGSVRSLAVLPLVNWHTARKGLRGETGVSYLVRTGRRTILFDVGYNPEQEHPSPLLHNMNLLGVSPNDVDIVFISHNHLDHVGGSRWAEARTFSLTREQIPLPDTTVYTPVPMTYPGLTPVHTPEPAVLAPGIATTGTIPRRLFIGRIDEQALVLNVEGKGLVLIVGCGHQTLTKLLERVETAFTEPIYGVIGDFHYPVPEGRLHVLGIDVQRYLASGTGPWNPVSLQDVERDIERLRRRSPGIVALGAHDTSDTVIEKFRDAFGSVYREARVGEWILVAGTTSS